MMDGLHRAPFAMENLVGRSCEGPGPVGRKPHDPGRQPIACYTSALDKLTDGLVASLPKLNHNWICAWRTNLSTQTARYLMGKTSSAAMIYASGQKP